MNTTLDSSDLFPSDELSCEPQTPERFSRSSTPFKLRLATPSCDDESLLQIAGLYRGTERRGASRYEISLGIKIQPLDRELLNAGSEFCGITREISQGGLSFLSSYPGNFRMAILSLQNSDSITDNLERHDLTSLVCRVCSTSLLHSNSVEKVYLTNVEFMREASQ